MRRLHLDSGDLSFLRADSLRRPERLRDRKWQQHGKKQQARRMLAEIYGWFTEGFDTVDLQEAKALLGELL